MDGMIGGILDPMHRSQYDGSHITGGSHVVPSITFRWRERGGLVRRELTLGLEATTGPDIDAAEALAREAGWPGHKGTRWDYFKDDLRKWLRGGRP